jgi:hypothetical protein
LRTYQNFKPNLLIGVFLFVFCLPLFSQEQTIDAGNIHGNFEIRGQYYRDDTLIGAPDVPEQVLFNGFLNLIYTRGKFETGLRYESYQNVLLGFSPNYKGNGIPYRYATYRGDNLEFTAGNFYEQFGNGQILRTYEERGLGIDNSIDGIRARYRVKGIQVTGLIGQQRFYFAKGPGIVRAADIDIDLNQSLEALSQNKNRFKLGLSAVSKYQDDENLSLTLPENVLSLGGRFSYYRSGFSLKGEYTYKYNDPSADNGYIYKDGQALFLSTSYSKKGLGITLSAHTLDNMFFRSDRNNRSIFNDLFINFIPALTKQHTYNLMATLYPYATQPRGEMAFQGDFIYKFKRKTPLGGKYGTTIQVNFSHITNLDTVVLNDENTTRLGYNANLFKPGKDKYFQDFNIEISKKLSKSLKVKGTYQNLVYNQDVIEGKPGVPNVLADVVVLDVLYNINSRNAVRTELQGLWTKQHEGDWATALVEYTYSPHWFIAVLDQYNYGNKVNSKQIHYVTASVGYIKDANRISFSYGRQRAGIFCVGGVCRVVPASNGFSVSITSSF